ncbi:GGDEF domain-containing protein [Bowmanella denitrificans]|uniref:GGDEF domain-containing protein n=1 Tax=Bowmanella denitrificans TaxID=366582 RepID=UPI001C0EC954|nr:sensor domain-containing diguanylate cyclase [Bowmanella denitrificans]
MKQNLELLMEMLAALPDPVFILSESGRYVALIGGHDARYYHDGSHLVNFSLHDVLPKELADWFLEQIRQTIEENRLRTVEYALGAHDVKGLELTEGPEQDIWFEGRIQPLSNPVDGERAVVWVARNITERHNMQLQLKNLAELDELTGAYNRRKLMEALDEKFAEFKRYHHPTSLMIFDLDHFKQVNDRFGHIAGDKVLTAMVKLCKKQLRQQDLLCRYGGEEFAVLLPNTDLEEATQLAERLRKTIGQYDYHKELGQAYSITVSAGVSALCIKDKIESLIKRADDGLYQAKASGRNCVISRSS